jgi:hypothetical protein
VVGYLGLLADEAEREDKLVFEVTRRTAHAGEDATRTLFEGFLFPSLDGSSRDGGAEIAASWVQKVHYVPFLANTGYNFQVGIARYRRKGSVSDVSTR